MQSASPRAGVGNVGSILTGQIRISIATESSPFTPKLERVFYLHPRCERAWQGLGNSDREGARIKPWAIGAHANIGRNKVNW